MSDSEFSSDGDVDLFLSPIDDEAFADWSDSSDDDDGDVVAPMPSLREAVVRKASDVAGRKMSDGVMPPKKKASVSFYVPRKKEEEEEEEEDEGEGGDIFGGGYQRRESLGGDFQRRESLGEDFQRRESVGGGCQRRGSAPGLSVGGLRTSPPRRLSVIVQPERNRRASIALRPSIAVNTPRLRWIQAIHKVRAMKDPWADFPFEKLMTETVKRHRYSSLRKVWTTDEVQVKIEKKAFNRGAMRECFRTKKLSMFHHHENWGKSHNYVAKRYIEPVERDVYFEDVKLQMDTKVWGEEYNRHNPPKKVDIMQMCIIEFVNRAATPLYHLERFIDGNYVKYNSNSGYVNHSTRCTPQAFSHFTFERSGHEVIVVDIQGVGDLWTDPQVHTSGGLEYGDGNLGTRGMALFFHSHVCNQICARLRLTPFDLVPSEKKHHEELIKSQKSSQTCLKGNFDSCIGTSTFGFGARRQRYTSFPPLRFSECDDEDDDEGIGTSVSSDSVLDTPTSPQPPRSGMPEPRRRKRGLSGSDMFPDYCLMRQRTVSGESSDSDRGTWTKDDEREELMASRLKHRPSSVAAEVDMTLLRQMASKNYGSILGMVHLDLAKYHEMGRFKEQDGAECDMDAAMFHLKQAVNCEVLEAIQIMAKLYLNMPTDIFSSVQIPEDEENIDIGVGYMHNAADAGDRQAMIHLAKAYDTGVNLGSQRERDWKQAVYWYDRAIHTDEIDAGGEFDSTMDDPMYMLMSCEAELWRKGGLGLTKDPSYAGELYTMAADNAMESMKGRLANKFYALAEEAWAEVEEPEE